MTGLVGDECDLGEEDAERCGDQQLEPARAKEDEAGDGTTEAEQQRDADQDVEPAGTPQQVGLPDLLRQVCVGPDQRREGGRV